MKEVILLCELINATLVKRPLNEKVFEGVTQTDWQRCFDLALQQTVLAMTFPTMSSLPKELRPSFTLWSKWLAYTERITKLSAQKRDVLKKIGKWLTDDNLNTMVIKGFSLAVLYPKPELRECADVDIYSGENYGAVNSCFAKHGVEVDNADGHHVHLKVDGISVEHHFALQNIRVKNGIKGPVENLKQLAAINQRTTTMPDISFPNPVFTALFSGWHAYKHFLHEKIELRHLIDWSLALKQLTVNEAEMLHVAKGDAPWCRFTDSLSVIALNQLHLPKNWFPQQELDLAISISTEMELRMWNDIISTKHTNHGRNAYYNRLKIARRMIKNKWKYEDYSDMSAERFLWKEFVGHFKKVNSL